MKTLSIYDFDETIMLMPTKINLKEFIKGKWIKRDVDSAEFALIRNNKNIKVDNQKSFSGFYNNDDFIKDLSQAINNNNIGPAFRDFKKTIISGDDFVIVTSRGHSFNTVLTGILMIIGKMFTTEELLEMSQNMEDIGDYLSNQKIFTIFSDEFKFVHCSDSEEYICGAERKKIAINSLLIKNNYISEYDKIIFFDDDEANLKSVKSLFMKISKSYPYRTFQIYNTSKQLTRIYYSKAPIVISNNFQDSQLR